MGSEAEQEAEFSDEAAITEDAGEGDDEVG